MDEKQYCQHMFLINLNAGSICGKLVRGGGQYCAYHKMTTNKTVYKCTKQDCTKYTASELQRCAQHRPASKYRSHINGIEPLNVITETHPNFIIGAPTLAKSGPDFAAETA